MFHRVVCEHRPCPDNTGCCFRNFWGPWHWVRKGGGGGGGRQRTTSRQPRGQDVRSSCVLQELHPAVDLHLLDRLCKALQALHLFRGHLLLIDSSTTASLGIARLTAHFMEAELFTWALPQSPMTPDAVEVWRGWMWDVVQAAVVQDISCVLAVDMGMLAALGPAPSHLLGLLLDAAAAPSAVYPLLDSFAAAQGYEALLNKLDAMVTKVCPHA